MSDIPLPVIPSKKPLETVSRGQLDSVPLIGGGGRRNLALGCTSGSCRVDGLLLETHYQIIRMCIIIIMK